MASNYLVFKPETLGSFESCRLALQEPRELVLRLRIAEILRPSFETSTGNWKPRVMDKGQGKSSELSHLTKITLKKTYSLLTDIDMLC